MKLTGDLEYNLSKDAVLKYLTHSIIKCLYNVLTLFKSACAWLHFRKRMIMVTGIYSKPYVPMTETLIAQVLVTKGKHALLSLVH